MDENKNVAIKAEKDHTSAVESAYDYLEHFDILETITNVGNDEVFTPRKTCDMILNSLPEEVWHNPNYKWLNPATKNGIFEREIAIRLDHGLKDIIPDEETRKKHILQNMIFAIGQTKFTANVARRTLYYCSQANRKCDGIKAPDGHYVNGYAIGNGTWFDDEEGNIKTPKTEHVFEKDGKCKFCGIKRDSKYNSSDQREHYAYEFIHHGKLALGRKLQDLFFKGDRNMKFDVIIGNPPYHLNDGGGTGESATPIYNYFVENAIFLNPRYVSMIIPAKWFSGGKGLGDFRKRMLNESHLSEIHDFSNFRDIFPSLGGLAGGACFFLWQRDYNGPCKIYNDFLDTFTLRSLNEFDIFIRDNRAVEIVNKVVNFCKAKGLSTMDNVVSNRLPFGIPTTYKYMDEGDIPCYFTQKIGLKYVSKKDVKDDLHIINKFKFLAPKAPIAGQTDFTKPVMFFYDGNTLIAKPGEIASESWLVLNSFDTALEAENFKNYVFSKIFRFLLLQTVVSQNLTKANYCFIPNFKDYKNRISDKELVDMFGLSDEEWKYINSRISSR